MRVILSHLEMIEAAREYLLRRGVPVEKNEIKLQIGGVTPQYDITALIEKVEMPVHKEGPYR